jgi:hypothetical protein
VGDVGQRSDTKERLGEPERCGEDQAGRRPRGRDEQFGPWRGGFVRQVRHAAEEE